jgi:acyl carrier protein
MDRQQIQTVVLTVLSTALKCEVDETASRETVPHWDSLKQIEVIFAIEDELNIQFPEEIMPELNSVVQIVNAAEEINAA